MKQVRGHNNGPPVMDGPMASGPIVNGAPVGGPILRPVNTPPREAHVLNDAILRAALDLSKRGKTSRKVIFVISDGRELGSKASYSDVLQVLETRDIQVKAVALDAGALPGFRQLGKIHLKDQGYGDILPKYATATGGGQVPPCFPVMQSKTRMRRSPPRPATNTLWVTSPRRSLDGSPYRISRSWLIPG